MKTNRILFGLVAAAVVFAMASPAMAQINCFPSKLFAGIGGGGGTDKQRIDPGASENAGNHIGRFWQAGSSNIGNMDASLNEDPAQCPSSGWYDLITGGMNAGLRGIDGIMGGTGCSTRTACPAGDVMFLVEDYDAGGPPGAGGTAYFWVSRMREAVSQGRVWDMFNLCPTPGTDCVTPMAEFPQVNVTSSNKVGNDVNLNINYGDPGLGAYVAGAATTLDSAAIASVDVFTSTTDAGRLRSGWGSPVATLPYGDTSVAGSELIDCSGQTDTYVAAGLTFDGVPSALVGKAVLVQCDPNIADPGGKIRPGAKTISPRPSSRGRGSR